MVRRFIQLVIIIIPIGLFVWLLVIDIAPSGFRPASWSVNEPSPFIDRLLPDQRLLVGQTTDDGSPYISIIEDPVYFSVHLPHTYFERMSVALTMRPTDQPIVEVGLLRDVASQAYELKPLYNALIDALPWTVFEQDGVSLYQRNRVYESLEAFYANPPERSRIAVYHADMEAPYRMPSYQPLDGAQTFDVSLRGYHKAITYIKDETLDLSVSWMDMNRTAGADEGVIRVRDEMGDVVYEAFFDDDANITENQVSRDSEAHIVLDGLDEGVYSLEFSGTSDIFWRSFTTHQRYFTFVNRLSIADDVGYLVDPRATTLFTSAKHLTALTLHADSTQRLAIGSDAISVDVTHEKLFPTAEDVGLVAGTSPVGDIEIIGDGKFAFSRWAFFDPDPVTMNAYTDVDVQEIDYVLTSYVSPHNVDGGWIKARGLFDLGSGSQDDLKLTVSVPGMLTYQGVVDVLAIDVMFEKEPLDWKEFLEAVRERLPFGL